MPRSRAFGPARPPFFGTAVSEQAGPSMSTEPGWMASRRVRRRCYLRWPAGGAARTPYGAQANYPSMLLSFERPAPAGARLDALQKARPQWAAAAGVAASPRSLKTAQKPHSRPSISGRLKTGITGFERKALPTGRT